MGSRQLMTFVGTITDIFLCSLLTAHLLADEGTNLHLRSPQLTFLLQLLPQASRCAQYSYPSHWAFALRIATYHEQERPCRGARHKSHPYAMARSVIVGNGQPGGQEHFNRGRG